MKKLLFTLALILTVITASFQAPIRKWMHPEKTVNKKISLEIPLQNNYKSKVYAHNAAKLDITLIKLRGQKADTLSVQEYPEFKLRNLPSFSKKFNHTIDIPNVVDSKEQIILSYNITYRNARGSVLKIQTLKWLPKGIAEEKVFITI